MPEEKQKKHRGQAPAVYGPIAVLLVVFIAVIGSSVFFRVSSIEVDGAKKYSAEQIISTSGIQKGSNLILIDAPSAAALITTNLPYLTDVTIEKRVPDRIVIHVTESQPLAVISDQGIWWLIDQKGRVLEKTDAYNASLKIQISGLTPTALIPGRQIAVADGDKTKLLYLTNILSALNNAGISNDVKTLDITSIANISLSYLGCFNVVMGSGEDADYKLAMLSDIVAQLSPDDRGRIDLSSRPALFSPA
ncbi:FtsQ-type POTRA domain-containing protein [Oscillospiraceae bacterium CM]|nr:FtsQ-type POTRA domain-containing protein [Oscillospiraceae bacterium CM]